MTEISQLAVLREREDHIEFKEAKHNYPFAGGSHNDVKERRKCVLGYVVAFANERGGRLVLGMADKMPHEVVGTDFAKDKVGELEDEIYRRLYIRFTARNSMMRRKIACLLSIFHLDRLGRQCDLRGSH